MCENGLIKGYDGKMRCWWCGTDREYIKYHDEEWGKPTQNDRLLFEKISLEGFQSGLSWLTILKKRENFRQSFANFNIEIVATFTQKDIERLMNDAGIVRHRGKIQAVINNAEKAIELRKEHGSLYSFFNQFKPGKNNRPTLIDKQALQNMGQTEHSLRLSKVLKKKGWKFVGPTTCYSFMQSMGFVNDHLHGCHVRPKYEEDL